MGAAMKTICIGEHIIDGERLARRLERSDVAAIEELAKQREALLAIAKRFAAWIEESDGDCGTLSKADADALRATIARADE